MEVIILAGGLGTRLRSAIGNDIPKCMADVNGQPFLYYLLEYLSRFDVTRVILSVGHLREVIFQWIEHVKDDYPFEFVYAVEETPLGTGGGIKLTCEHCREKSVVVLNGDTFFNVPLDEFVEYTDASVKLALKPMVDFDRYGTVELVNGVIEGFKEKQHCSQGLINGGVYLINRTKINWPDADKFSFEKDLLENRSLGNLIMGEVHNSYFIDIGIPKDYHRFAENLKQKGNEIL